MSPDGKSCLIIPKEMAPPAAGWSMVTPYGEVWLTESPAGLPALVREEGADARARIYAAKEIGATGILAAELVQPVSPLLEKGDLVIPADLIDQTKLRPFTFFVGKGYGFIKLNPPFCPDLMQSLFAAARSASLRSFQGAIYVGGEGPRNATAAELRLFRQWGADLIGHDLIPEVYLARELEICYAAVTVVDQGDLVGLLDAAAGRVRGAVACACRESMRLTKEQGVVGEDWRRWIT